MHTNKKILLSGITPSGVLHIGNYLGALKQWVELQKTHRVFAMIADLHAITTPQEPEKLRAKTLEVAALFVAAGIDPERSVVFVQSHVPAHAQLAWMLNTFTPVGELERMTQFKEKKGKAGVLAGLLNYPTLMAADILLYQADVVPVGEDQKQHLELTRTLAQKFNTRFGKTFKIPQALVQKDAARVMSLNDPSKKMSKSAENAANYISLLDAPDEIRKKIKIAVTDSEKDIRSDEREKPAIANLMRIYGAFSGASLKELEKKYESAGYAEFKSDLAELIIEKLTPIQKTYDELKRNEIKIENIIKKGAEDARETAEKTLSSAKEKMGFFAFLF